jgi:hypothetical protein
MAYIGQTGCSIKTGTTDSSILNNSAVVEHGINILLKDKCVLARKYSHMNYIMWDVIVTYQAWRTSSLNNKSACYFEII